MKKENNRSSAWAPWLAFSVAIFASTVTAVSSFHLRHLDTKARIRHEVLEERKAALFQALHVIDLVYANSDFPGLPSAAGPKWDIQLARDAMNRMVVYCEDPDKTIRSFIQAVGLHNPSVESPPRYNAGNIHDFRKEVARELELPEITYGDLDKTWIYSLPGTDEYELMKRLTNKSIVR